MTLEYRQLTDPLFFVFGNQVFFLRCLLLFYSLPFDQGGLFLVCGIQRNNDLCLVDNRFIFT
jgi:hypothetical protein